MPKDPEKQPNTITFRTKADCIEVFPQPLKFCKRNNHLDIFLHAPRQNNRAINLTFSETTAGTIFQDHPSSPLTLDPGRTVGFKIKKNIDGPGLNQRPDFGNPTDGDFADFGRLFSFEFGERRCDPGDGNDVHIEC